MPVLPPVRAYKTNSPSLLTYQDIMSVRGNSDRRRNRLTGPYEARTKEPKLNDDGEVKAKPEASLKFLLSNVQCGVLIGNGGSLRRELIEITGADVHVSNVSGHYPGTNLRCVYITGSGNNVNLAQALIWEMIGQQTHAVNSGERSLAWHPSVAKANPGEHDEVRVEGKITIPAPAAGLIVGKGGATIRSIAEESSTEVTIDNREDAEITNERVISMRGTAAGCMNCTYMILSKMAADEQEYYYLVNGTTYRGTTTNRGGGGGGRDRDRDRDYDRDAGEERGEPRERGGRRRGGGKEAAESEGNGAPRARTVEVVRPGHNEESSDNGGRESRGRGARNSARGGGGASKAAIPTVGMLLLPSYSFLLSNHVDIIDLSFAAAGVPAEMLRAHTTLELGVPDNLIGAILGVQGAKLAQIEDMSGAKVTVSKRYELYYHFLLTYLMLILVS